MLWFWNAGRFSVSTKSHTLVTQRLLNKVFWMVPPSGRPSSPLQVVSTLPPPLCRVVMCCPATQLYRPTLPSESVFIHRAAGFIIIIIIVSTICCIACTYYPLLSIPTSALLFPSRLAFWCDAAPSQHALLLSCVGADVRCCFSKMFDVDETLHGKSTESEKRTLLEGTANWAAKVAITGINMVWSLI